MDSSLTDVDVSGFTDSSITLDVSREQWPDGKQTIPNHDGNPEQFIGWKLEMYLNT